MLPPIHFDAITHLLASAEAAGRNCLLEHEVYQLLARSGAETPPQTHLLLKGARLSDEELMVLPGDRVVLKIVSPDIVHKTEVGGVQVVANTPQRIRSVWRRMQHEVTESFAARLSRQPELRPPVWRGLSADAVRQAIADRLVGVLMVQYMPPDSEAFGNEMIVGIRHTREFGMIISAGLGGTDTELYAARFRAGQAIVAAATGLTDGPAFFELFRRTISYQKLAGLTRGQRRIVTDEQLLECFSAFIALANHYSGLHSKVPYLIEELEINPFAFTDYLMVPLDGLCRFARPQPQPARRPDHKIHQLLHPRSIGIIGVSTTRLNYGRIILNNIRAAGFPASQIWLLRPDQAEFEGLRGVASLAELPQRLDLLVVAVAAGQVPDLITQIIETRAAETVMLISGGLGETPTSQDRADQVRAAIQAARLQPDGGPIFLGANCLGVISQAGKYDTLFIPEAKLPKRRGPQARTVAFVSQSGAFMITRLSKYPEIDPAYLISVGNQTDLTLGDFLRYLKDVPSITTIAVYAEGFRDLDGLHFSRALRAAVRNGKEVILYKAGRTPEGQHATSGHTASLAGDYMVCESCVRQAGGMVAQHFTQFEDLILLSQHLHGRQINGHRLAALSGAGFEAVGIADNIQTDDFQLGMARLQPSTIHRIQDLLAARQLNHLVTVGNPLDITPQADDQLHVQTAASLLQDEGVDALVIGLDPLSPAMRTLAACDAQCYNFDDPASIASAMPELVRQTRKPVIGVVDGGRLYDPLVDILIARGMVVFRSSDRAVQALALYIQGRLQAEAIRALEG